MTSHAPRHSLRSVTDAEPKSPLRIFCGHCGRQPADQAPLAGRPSRVCAKCGMGLLLQAPAELAPSTTDSFLIIDGYLTVCAVSRQAERLLNISETEAVNRHVSDFVTPGDSEQSTSQSLAALLAWAARGDSPQGDIVVRPTNTYGVRYWAKIGPCGPPAAALLVLADAG